MREVGLFNEHCLLNCIFLLYFLNLKIEIVKFFTGSAPIKMCSSYFFKF